MNIFKRIIIRLYQKILYLFSLLLNFKEPLVISGKDSFNRLVEELKKHNFKHVFLVTGKRIHSLKLDELLTKLLDNENIKYTLYFDFTTDPTIKQINDGANLYINNKCDCIVAIGGGSIMDGAKGIGIKVNNKKDLIKMKGLLRVKQKPPFNVLIPTTAGSGSEVSIAAVIINEDNKEKFPIEDLKLIPNVVALNPNLLVNLPTFITAYTGMDALTHAIEAYLGNSNTKESNKNALEFAKFLSNNNVPVWIRHVLVPTINTQKEYLIETRKFIDTLTNVKKVEILPYHTLGISKYEMLNIPYLLKGINPPSKEEIELAKSILIKE